MKRISTLLLIVCLLLAGCGSDSGELTVETQRQAAVAASVPTTEETAPPVTQAPTVPSTAPTEVPTEEATEEPTEEPTEEVTEEPTEPPTEAPTEPPTEAEPEAVSSPGQDYVLNKNTKKFHYPYCSSVSRMKAKNRKDFFGSREEVISMGYVPCKNCDP